MLYAKETGISSGWWFVSLAHVHLYLPFLQKLLLTYCQDNEQEKVEFKDENNFGDPTIGEICDRSNQTEKTSEKLLASLTDPVHPR